MKIYVTLLILLCCSFWGNCQMIRFSGKVLDKSNQKLLEGASIQLSSIKMVKYSDKTGEFMFPKFKTGKYSLTIKYLGFLNYKKILDIQKDTLIEVELTPFVTELEEVIVSSKVESSVNKLNIGINSLSKEQILNVPSIAGEHDLTRIFMLTPGVKSDNEGSAGLYVRGGTSDQNLFLINSAPLYKNSHLFGFLSPFNSDIIEKADLYKGGFPARFGGRLSSILDVRLKSASMNKFKIGGSIGFISSKLYAEIPIVKEKVSLLLAGRRSYFDIFTAFFNGSGTTSGPYYKFYDFNGILTLKLDKKNIIQLFTYHDKDRLTGAFDGETETQKYDQSWNSQIWGVSFTSHLSPIINNYIDFTLSDYNMDLEVFRDQQGEAFINKFNSQINTFGVKNTTEIEITDNYAVKFGGIYNTYTFRPGQLRYQGKNINFIESKLDSIQSKEVSLFIENEFKFNKWIANLGFRYSSYQVPNQTYQFKEPRLTLGYIFNEKSSLKMALSQMNQPLQLLTNPGLGFPVDLWVSSTDKIIPQKSNQISLSYNHDISQEKNNFLSLSIEAYYKEMNNIISYRDGYSSTDFTEFSQNNQREWDKIVTQGKGKSYGIEALLEKKYGKLQGWIGYTLSWTTNQFENLNLGKEFYARQDRRHDLSVVAMYKLNKRWSLNASWIFQTGQAITLPKAVYSIPAYGFVKDKFLGYPNLAYINGERNSYRMIPTHRLDIGVQRKTTHKWGIGQWELSLYNAYNRQNPYYYYIDSGQRVKSVSLFGIIPSFSYMFKIYSSK
ncbi:MAG: TonB-dependent receptor [Arcicella sp.]|nr:TonB-dependent receptor [Arcicella sp.]